MPYKIIIVEKKIVIVHYTPNVFVCGVFLSQV